MPLHPVLTKSLMMLSKYKHKIIEDESYKLKLKYTKTVNLLNINLLYIVIRKFRIISMNGDVLVKLDLFP